MFGFERGVFGASQKLGSGNLLCGAEACHDDGPWVHPDDYSHRGFDTPSGGITIRLFVFA